MGRIVRKYTLGILPASGWTQAPCVVEIPRVALLLHVGIEGDGTGEEGFGPRLCLWAEVDTESPPITRTYYAYPTGYDIPDGLRHVGTVLAHPFAWHVYDATIFPMGQEPDFIRGAM